MSANSLRKRHIYALIDPRTSKIGYIGQTVRTVGHRLPDHVAAARRGGATYKDRWIRSMLASNLVPEVDVIEEGYWDQDQCDAREAYWIDCLKKSPLAQLTNVLPGGTGVCGGPRTDDQKERQSKSLKRYLSTPEGQQQRRQQMIDRYNSDPEARQRDTAGLRAYYANKENHAAFLTRCKKLYDDEPERRQIISDEVRQRWLDPEYKARQTLQSDEYRARRSAIAREMFSSPEARDRLKEQGKKSSSIEVVCNDCNKTGKLPSFGTHLKFSGHSGYSRLLLDGGGE